MQQQKIEVSILGEDFSNTLFLNNWAPKITLQKHNIKNFTHKALQKPQLLSFWTNFLFFLIHSAIPHYWFYLETLCTFACNQDMIKNKWNKNNADITSLIFWSTVTVKTKTHTSYWTNHPSGTKHNVPQTCVFYVIMDGLHIF